MGISASCARVGVCLLVLLLSAAGCGNDEVASGDAAAGAVSADPDVVDAASDDAASDDANADASASNEDATNADAAIDDVAAADAAPLACPVDDLVCDDGDPCTLGDHCKGGACVAGTDVCDCRVAADCPSGNACLGKATCDTSKVPYRCAIEDGTAVQCLEAAPNACQTSACNPATGACETTPRPDGTLCTGSICALTSVCNAGVCESGPKVCACEQDADCTDDGNACNGTPYCDKSKFPFSCKANNATVVKCGDGDGASPCVRQACDPTTGTCSATEAALTVQACVEGVGCGWEVSATPTTVTCDDNNACTDGTTCDGKTCGGGTQLCLCSKEADCAGKEDGNLCNGTLYCDGKTGSCVVNPASVVTCQSGADTPCLKNQCAPATGTCAMVAVKAGTPCEDGEACTSGDVCGGGVCVAGINTCKCTSDSECPDNDDNACNGGGWCDPKNGFCKPNPAQSIFCSTIEDTACLKNACVPLSGACTATAVERTTQICPVEGVCRRERLPSGAPPSGQFACSDGDPCTTGDLCGEGSCASGVPTCQCKQDGDCNDDGDLCNGVPYCDKSNPAKPVCKTNVATVVNCNGNLDTTCRKAACQPKSGLCALVPEPTGLTCDDGNACTASDSCLLGECVGTDTCECQTNADCSDKEDGDQCNGTLYCDKSDPTAPKCVVNPVSVVTCPASVQPCLAYACIKANGQCLLGQGPDGAVCADGDACTGQDACKSGVCVGVAKDCDDSDACTVDACSNGACVHTDVSCKDGNSCTLDSCESATGTCVFGALPMNGSGCNGDNSGCTVSDTCLDGVCKAGAAVTCTTPTNAPACREAVCASTGASTFECVLTKAKDGAVCDDGDACSGDGACLAGSCSQSEDKLLHQQLVALPNAATVAGNVRAEAIALDAKGALVVTGRSYDKLGKRWWIGRVAATGQVLGHCAVNVDADAIAARPVGVFPLGGGKTVLIGSTGASDVELAMTTVRVTADCKLESVVLVGDSDAGERLTRARQVGNSGYLGVGDRVQPSGARAYVGRVTAGGQMMWSWTDSGFGLPLQDAAVQADGNSVVVGAAVDPNNPDQTLPRVVFFDAKGTKVLERKELAFGGTALTTIAIRPDGGFAVAGTRSESGKSRSWWARLASDGTVARHLSGALDVLPSEIVAAQGGWVLIGSALPAQQSAGLWMVRLDDAGNQRWEIAGPAGTASEGVRALVDDGGIWIGGGAVAEGRGHALIERADSWGRASCEDSGVCSGKTWTDCDDGKLCSTDHCGPIKGCVHLSNTGWVCEDGLACNVNALCQLGACVADSNGLLHTKSFEVDGLAGMVGVSAVGNGAVVAGITGGKAVAYDIEPSAGITNVTTLVDKALAGYGAVRFSDGKLVMAYADSPHTTRIGAFDSTGKVLWDKQVCQRNSEGGGYVGKCWYPSPDIRVNNCAGHLERLSDGKSVVWVSAATYQDHWCFGGGTVGNCHYIAQRLWTLKLDAQTGADVGKFSQRANGWGTDAGGYKCGSWPGYHFGSHYVTAPRVMPTSDGGMALVGHLHQRLQYGGAVTVAGVIERYFNTMELMWRREVFIPDGVPTLRTGVELKGNILAAGESVSTINKLISLLAVETDAAGKELWRMTALRVGFWKVGVVAPEPDGVIIGGTELHEGTEQFWLERRDRKGALIWGQQYGFGATLIGAGIWQLPTGGFAGFGVTSTNNIGSIGLLRTDDWGHGDCKAAGGCFGKAEADCDDLNPCTADACSGATGKCSHAPSSGAACAGGVCAAGVCAL